MACTSTWLYCFAFARGARPFLHSLFPLVDDASIFLNDGMLKVATPLKYVCASSLALLGLYTWSSNPCGILGEQGESVCGDVARAA